MTTNFLILGASARAAAMSAEMCGYNLWCADRFGDVDLLAIADVELCEDYPAALPRIMSDAPSGPWIYTGALENRPEILEQMISKRYPLLGNGPDVVRLVRDPFNWTAVLKQAMLPHAEVRRLNKNDLSGESLGDLSKDSRWLVKPIRSASGSGIHFWDDAVGGTGGVKGGTTTQGGASTKGGTGGLPTSVSDVSEQFFLQRYVPGVPIAAIYVAARRTAVLLGTTKQLIGKNWCKGTATATDGGTGSLPNRELFETFDLEKKFTYCGSVGPLHFDDDLTEQLQAIGATFAKEFNLKGLFGVDAILTSDNKIVPVEINPRYTASIEVLERASQLGTLGTRGKQLKAIQLHVEACTEEKLPDRVMPVPNAMAGKAILFVPKDQSWRFSNAVAQWAVVRNLSSSRPMVADIPHAESPLAAGQPILTLLAEGKNEADVMSELLVQTAECYDLLHEWNE